MLLLIGKKKKKKVCAERMQSCFSKQEQSGTKFGKCHSQSVFGTDVWVGNFIVHINEGLVLAEFQITKTTQIIYFKSLKE